MLELKAPPTLQDLEASIAAKGANLWKRMQGEVPGIFNADFWQGKIMEWAMRDPEFRVDLFRFVDVLPALQDRKQVYAHLKDYLLREGRELPPVLSMALKAASGGLTGMVAVEVIKRNLVSMAENFIVGETVDEAMKALKKLNGEGLAFTADLLGEATLTREEGETYLQRYRELIESLAEATPDWKAEPLLRQSQWGEMPLANVSLKLSALEGRLDPVNAKGSVANLVRKLKPLFVLARQRGIALNLDLETWALHDIAYGVFEQLALDPELRDWPYMGIVVQAYLNEAPQDVRRLLELAKRRGAPVSVRLVKGAYWDYEVAMAQQRSQVCPVLQGKALADAQYESLTRLLLDEVAHCFPAFGSHNLRSIVHALAYAEARGIPKEAFEVQMLFGMAEPERVSLREQGYRVRVYAPIGDLLLGMAYLVRRLLENTSNSGFLRQTYHEHTDIRQLLSSPTGRADETTAFPVSPVESKTTFRNTPLLDFAQPSVRASFEDAVQRTLSQEPMRIPVVVQGQSRYRDSDWEWKSPNDGSVVVFRSSLATVEEADASVREAHQVFPNWRRMPWPQRGDLLLRLADVLERKRIDLAALQTQEVGKPWAEADADVAEAIDFCRYYAHRAPLELADEPLLSPPGETNVLRYQGRGVCMVIAPWNFPLAILTGMTVAALMAGNTVVLKPAEQSLASGYALYQALVETGFPDGVVQFLPGLGETIGPTLVNHPLTAHIAFTGSFAVGTRILQDAAKLQPGQRQFKRVICELGGKNALIVDDDADWDEAIAAIAKSAFGFAGQKCSAGSRLFVVGKGYAEFMRRLCEHMQTLSVLPATDPACDIPPVVDADAHARLQELENGFPGARLLARGKVGTVPAGGRYVAPMLFEVDSAEHRFMQEEFFGPVLAVLRAETFEQALAWVQATPYALTGAVFSRRPSHIALAREAFDVGNLYINRPSTGAMVGRQPFGGFGHSGLGTKAGGPGYLRLFADPKVICENTMRHGFSPETT
jgi:RHH-type transcriptional regulator, proline utilization regulon repressor / proline dehydrogenase / delta 1-pyrroline-5-carboxylate dehydrogenase